MSQKSTAKEKEQQDQLKTFLKDSSNFKDPIEIRVNEDLRAKIGSISSLSDRLEACEDLKEALKTKRLEELGVECIWMHVSDLVALTNPPEIRHLIIDLLIAAIKNVDKIGIGRMEFLRYIARVRVQEDTVVLFKFFSAIIKDGHDIEYIDDELGVFLRNWIGDLLLKVNPCDGVIDVLTNIYRFNIAMIEYEDVVAITHTMLKQVTRARTNDEIYAYLRFMDALIAYAYIPFGQLEIFITNLAQLSNIPIMVEPVWKVVKNLLRTGRGDSSIIFMVEFIQKNQDFHKVRGCIFFLSRGLFTKERPTALTIQPFIPLRSYLLTCRSMHPLIIYETAISINKLLKYAYEDLHGVTWNFTVEILLKCGEFAQRYQIENKENAQLIFNILNSSLDEIESIDKREKYVGDHQLMFDMFDFFADHREIDSVKRMLDYKIGNLLPFKDDKQHTWIPKLEAVVKKNFRCSSRWQIRLYVLQLLRTKFNRVIRRRNKYGTMIANSIIQTQLFDIDKDPDIRVRKMAVSLMVDIVQELTAPVVLKVIKFLENIILAPYKSDRPENVIELNDSSVDDIMEAVEGLILIFKKRYWDLPSSIAINAYLILMNAMEMHYRNMHVMQKAPCIRTKIFDLIFLLRANEAYHLGMPNCPIAQLAILPEDDESYKFLLPHYSPYIVVDHKKSVRLATMLSWFDSHKIDLKFETSPSGLSDENAEKTIDGVSSNNPSTSDNGDSKDDSNRDEGESDESTGCGVSEVHLKMPNEENVVLRRRFSQNFHRPLSKENVRTYDSSLYTKDSDFPDHYGFSESSDEEDEDDTEFIDMLDLVISDETPIERKELARLVLQKKTHSGEEYKTRLSLTKSAMIVIVAMRKEREWPLLKSILERVPGVLQNKALILSKDGSDVGYLAMTLCSLVRDQTLDIPKCLHNTPEKFARADFNAFIYPVMASLSSYHKHLDQSYQRDIIECLLYGIQSKSAPQCVAALTICILEMKSAMRRMLKEVIFSLSKMSSTVQNAQPTLEFLSTLLHLPSVYTDFVPNHYMSVFAVCIPYTNPYKFNHYVVSLAYHVIAMWFLKSRLNYRKTFVTFIAKNLSMTLNLESRSYRMRKAEEAQAKNDVDTVKFHDDLREACIDFMALNCFDSISPYTPERSPFADMLLTGGKQQSWLCGTRLITVSTPSCTNRPAEMGLCEKCVENCSPAKIFGVLPKDKNDEDADTETESINLARAEDGRKRHKSEFNRSVSAETRMRPKSSDDIKFKASISTEGPAIPNLKLKPGAERVWSGVFPPKIQNQPLNPDQKYRICICWCKKWAEITIRQPTGTTSFLVRGLNPRRVSDEEKMTWDDLENLYGPFNASSVDSGYEEFMTSLAQSIPRTPVLSEDLESISGIDCSNAIGIVPQENLVEPISSESADSSGTTSLTSSETKLDTLTRDSTSQSSDQFQDQCSVQETYRSTPEIAKIASQDGCTQDHRALCHSTSLAANMQTSLMKEPESPEIKVGSGTVRRTKSNVGSPSPPPTGARMRHQSAAQATTSSTSKAKNSLVNNDQLEPVKRDRGHTISVMNPAASRSWLNIKTLLMNRRPTLGNAGSLAGSVSNSNASISSSFSLPSEGIKKSQSSQTQSSSSSGAKKNEKDTKGGVSPSTVFLTFFWQWRMNLETSDPEVRPLLLDHDRDDIKRALRLLDYIQPQENHKVGVVYVGPGQNTEGPILKNTTGTARYLRFLKGLGEILDMITVDSKVWSGGLDKTGVDGNLLFMWQDDIMRVVFHVATHMPNKASDPLCTNKKRHIGNNYVTIVYNNSGIPYVPSIIKSQFNHTIVEIVPGDHDTNHITLICKPEMSSFVYWGQKDIARIVSDENLPLISRQLALHADLAATVWESLRKAPGNPYSTSWVEWLRTIRKLRQKLMTEQAEMMARKAAATTDKQEPGLRFVDFIDICHVEKEEKKERVVSGGVPVKK